MSSPKTRLFPRASSGPLLFQVPALPGQLLRATLFLPVLPSARLSASLNRASPRAPLLLPRDSPRLRCRRTFRIRPAAAPAHGKAVLFRKPALLKGPKNTVAFPTVVRKEPPFPSVSDPDSGKRLRESFPHSGRFSSSVLSMSAAPSASHKKNNILLTLFPPSLDKSIFHLP